MSPRTAGVLLCVIFLGIYAPDMGHGFLRDDYGWIAGSRLASFADLPRLFLNNVGFYRPLVSVSFALDYSIWRLNPFGYALTNLILVFADAALLLWLLRRFHLPESAALVGTAVWLFNFHAVNMALLWISGRTELLLCLFGLASAHAFAARRLLWTGVFVFAALLCKEEAILLPVMFVVIEAASRRGRTWVRGVGDAIVVLWPLWAATTVYAALRMHSGAIGPFTAPDYYRFTFAPALILRNMLEYFDRAATWPLFASVLLAACAWRAGPLNDTERRAAGFGALWFLSMYGLTMFLPVRSSLYALAPSVGSAFVVGAVAARTRRSQPHRFRRLAAVFVILVVAAVPVYRTRNLGWVPAADLAANVLRDLHVGIQDSSGSGRIILVDEPDASTNLAEAFWTAFPDAVHLFVGANWSGEIVTSSPGSTSEADTHTYVFALHNGGLVPASSP